MIEKFYLDEWRQIKAPWLRLSQVEQDLIISRALVNLYSHPKIRESLVFRGGTCLNKLVLSSPARYSEDIDLVQKNAEQIGETLDAIKSVLDWLGIPKRKLTERSAKLVYQYKSSEDTISKLKIEINTTEHYKVLDHIVMPYEVKSQWFSGEVKIVTYQLEELMGTKLRALYQRRKGRDLFDLWLMITNKAINASQVVKICLEHCKFDNMILTRKLFERNLIEKAKHEDFREEVTTLITADTKWDFDEAYNVILDQLISRFPDAL